ncbi:MAG: heparinase II/III family protein [Flavobacteriaceae bacterium]
MIKFENYMQYTDYQRASKLSKIRLLVMTFFCCLVCNSVLYAQESTYKLDNPITVDYIKKKLRKESPRLVLNEKLEKNLRDKLKTDPVIQNIYKAIKLNAEHVFERSIINLDIPMEERSQNNQLDISRDMLYRMNMLGMVYRIEKDKRMLDRINEEVIAACNFPSWNPKHFLDVSEMSLAIALAIDWAGDGLPGSTVKLAKKALIEKGIKPSWPEDGSVIHWVNSTGNWNQVCNGGMVAGAITIAEIDPELASKTIHRAIDAMMKSLDSYGPDGAYPEGATYWRYGTSFSVATAAMFESAFGTDFGMYNYPAFKESATFKKMCLAPSGRFYNYGDCGENPRKEGDLTLAWFAMKSGNSSFYDTERFMTDPEEMGTLNKQSAMGLVWMAQYEPKEAIVAPLSWKGDGKNPVVFFTGGDDDSNKYYFGGKGGKGTQGHGNMDAGSFIFELYGERWSVDLGKFRHYGTIERTGFDLWKSCQECDRWKLINKNNFGHSTITINNQLHVNDGKTLITDFKSGDRPEATLNMSPTLEGQVKSARRRFIKDGPISLLIEDDIELLESTEMVTWQFMTQADVELVKGGAILRQNGKSIRLEILSHPDFTPSVVSLDPPPLYLDMKKEGLKRIDIRYPAWVAEEDKLEIKVRLVGN